MQANESLYPPRHARNPAGGRPGSPVHASRVSASLPVGRQRPSGPRWRAHCHEDNTPTPTPTSVEVASRSPRPSRDLQSRDLLDDLFNLQRLGLEQVGGGVAKQAPTAGVGFQVVAGGVKAAGGENRPLERLVIDSSGIGESSLIGCSSSAGMARLADYSRAAGPARAQVKGTKPRAAKSLAQPFVENVGRRVAEDTNHQRTEAAE